MLSVPAASVATIGPGAKLTFDPQATTPTAGQLGKPLLADVVALADVLSPLVEPPAAYPPLPARADDSRPDLAPQLHKNNATMQGKAAV
jgi:hypothetical protein